MSRDALAVLFAVAACGDSIALPDAPPVDSAVAARPVTLELHPTSPGVPRTGRVYFLAADSTPILSTRLDGNGRASAFMPEGGSVTLITDTTSPMLMYTYTDVAPGAHLVVGNDTDGTLTTVQLTIPRDDATSEYRLHTACGSDETVDWAVGPPLEVLLRGCGERTDMLVISKTPDAPDRYVFRDDVSLASDGRVAIEGSYREFSTTQVTLAPASYTRNLTIEQGIALGQRAYASERRDVFVRANDPVPTETRALPLAPNATLLTTVQEILSALYVIDWRPAVDHVALESPELRMRRQLTAPVFDEASSSVTWTEEPEGLAPTHTYLVLNWAGANFFHLWRVFSPRTDGARVRLPVLPDPLLRPTRAASTANSYRLALTGDALDVIGIVLGRWSAGARWPITGERGSVVWEPLTPR